MNDRLAAKPESGLPAAVAAPVKGGSFQITPFMALAVSLIYMLTADGEIDDHESSQLQAVVGGHNELLDISIAYAEENSVEQFLKETSGLLNQEDHWCILANLCDCLLSDGVADDHELTLFRQISEAFGVSEMSFKTHFSNLSFKNNKSLLGKFSSKSLTLSGESAHLTLACSLLYMMAVDGNIAEEEIGQLQVVLGEFEGLQAVAMQTVRTVKMNVFLRQAAPLLTQDQKIMILSNVCDSMMSDGKVDVIEDNLFQSMLGAFSVPMSVFKSFYETIKIKCIKPFDTESIPTAFHSRVASKKKNDQSGSFKIRHQKKSADDAEATGDSSGKPEGDWVSEVDQKQLSAVVHRTMQDNIKQANESFSGQSDVENVQNNAVNSPPADFSKSSPKNENLQKAQYGVAKDNIQKAPSSQLESNQPSVVDASVAANIQSVTDDAIKSNSQKTVDTALAANIQSVTDDAIKSNSQKTVDTALAANIQSVTDDAIKSNSQKTVDTALAANIQSVTDDAIKSNPQKTVDTALAANIQSIPVDPLSDSKIADKDPSVRPSSSDSTADKLPNHELLGSTLAQAPALKMVDPKAVLDLQSQIDKVHSNLDKLSPAKTPKEPVSAFASLVLETRLPANNQLKQKPASSLPQATQVASLPIFEKNLQPLADEPLRSGEPARDKTASIQNKASENKPARPSKEAVESVAPLASQTAATDKTVPVNVDTTMLSNLTHAVHCDDVWGNVNIDLNEEAPKLSSEPLGTMDAYPEKESHQVVEESLTEETPTPAISANQNGHPVSVLPTASVGSLSSDTQTAPDESSPDQPSPVIKLEPIAKTHPTVPALATAPAPDNMSDVERVSAAPATSTHNAVWSQESPSDTSVATEPVLSDGSVDWRILLLLLALFSMPAVIFGRGLLYPSQTCHGVGQSERKWAPQGADKLAKVVHEETVSLTHSIRFSPSQIWVDGQRFPLYKELNQTSHFAESTPNGVKGSFNTQGIAKTRYTFVYDQATQELRIDMQSSGLGTEEGRVGQVEENTSFIGRCSTHWF